MKRHHILSIPIVFFVALIVTGVVLMPSCGRNKKPTFTPGTGEGLAKAYCGTCHLFPEPSLLDKVTWKERVLPDMGWRLGIREPGDDPYAEMEKDEANLVKALNLFPDKELLPLKDWEKIVAYYLEKAPDNPLPQKNRPSLRQPATGISCGGGFFYRD